MPTATRCAAPWSPAARKSRPWRRTSRPESGSGSGSRRTGNPSAPLRRDSSVQRSLFPKPFHLSPGVHTRFAILLCQCRRTRVHSTEAYPWHKIFFGRTRCPHACIFKLPVEALHIRLLFFFSMNKRLQHTRLLLPVPLAIVSSRGGHGTNQAQVHAQKTWRGDVFVFVVGLLAQKRGCGEFSLKSCFLLFLGGGKA